MSQLSAASRPHADCGAWQAMAVLDEMEAAQLPPDTWTYNTLLNVLSKAGRCDDAFALVDRMRAASPRVMQDAVTFNTLLSSCVQSGQVTLHAPTPPRQGVCGFHHGNRSDVWLTWSRVCCVHEHPMAAMHHTTGPLRGRRSSGWACVQVQRAEEAVQLMRRAGHKVGLMTWNTLLAVCQSAADAPAAMRTMQLMTAAGSDVKPDLITFNTALGACVRGAAWLDATTVFERMQESGVQCAVSPPFPIPLLLSQSSWAEALYLSCTEIRGHVSHGWRGRSRWCGTCRPDANTMQLAVAAVGDDWELGVRRYESMSQVFGFAPDYSATSSLLAVLVAAGRTEEATGLVESMREQGLPPRMAEYDQLVRMHCHRMAERIHTHQRNHTGCRADWARALEVLDTAAEFGLQPTPATFSLATASLHDGPTVPESQQNLVVECTLTLWTKLRELGMQPDAKAYDSLISVLGRAKDFTQAESAAREAREAGLHSSSWALTALALCAHTRMEVQAAVALCTGGASHRGDERIISRAATLHLVRKCAEHRLTTQASQLSREAVASGIVTAET